MPTHTNKLETINLSGLILLLTIFALGCQQPKQVEESTVRESKGGIALGGTFHINESAKPTSLYPADIDNQAAGQLAAQVYDGLLKFNPENLELTPNLAESWSVDESGTLYTFELEKGVFFHDDICFGGGGRELTAQDVKYALGLLCKSEESNKGYAAVMKGKVWGADEFHEGKTNQVSGIQVTDKHTLEIKLIHPNQSFLYALASPQASIIPKEAIERYGKNARVGSGPFVYSEKGGYVVLERNENYHRSDAFGNQLPYLDRVHVSFIPQKDKELEAFLNGELHLVSGLRIDPVRDLMDASINDFQGENPKYILERSSEVSANEVYTLKSVSLQGFSDNFMNYRDFSVVWLKE